MKNILEFQFTRITVQPAFTLLPGDFSLRVFKEGDLLPSGATRLYNSCVIEKEVLKAEDFGMETVRLLDLLADEFFRISESQEIHGEAFVRYSFVYETLIDDAAFYLPRGALRAIFNAGLSIDFQARATS